VATTAAIRSQSVDTDAKHVRNSLTGATVRLLMAGPYVIGPE
jgi:hypothetical protein